MIKAPFQRYSKRSELPGFKSIFLFLSLVLALTLPIILVRDGSIQLPVDDQILRVCYVCSPGLAALIVWFHSGGNTLSFTWKIGSGRYLSFALICPVAVGFLVYLPLWWSGIASFDPDALSGKSSPVLTRFVNTPLFVLAAACFGALAEEIGWRGFLLPALAPQFGFASLTWLIWVISFLFQMPNIVLARNPAALEFLALGALTFATTIILNWLRLGSGSVWPPALFRITHNLLVVAIFDPLTRSTVSNGWLVGEFGLGFAMGYLAIAILLFFTLLTAS